MARWEGKLAQQDVCGSDLASGPASLNPTESYREGGGTRNECPVSRNRVRYRDHKQSYSAAHLLLLTQEGEILDPTVVPHGLHALSALKVPCPQLQYSVHLQ